MNRFQKSLLGLLVLSTSAFGNVRDDVSSSIRNLHVTKVEREGVVLKSNRMFPTETILVGIPALVSTGDVCTDFVGQETRKPGRIEKIVVKGSSDPLVDACIQILPAPVETILTTQFRHRNDVVRPQGKILTKVVQIENTLYRVQLNTKTQRVTIHSNRPVPVPMPTPR